MLYSFRFFLSWILSAIVMYGAFYIWHGVFLNDLNSITFPKVIFLGLAALVYLAISFVLYRTYDSKLFNKLFFFPMFRGIASGFFIGFLLFSFVTVLGISFTKNINITYILADCAWQIVEQIIGGLIIALGKIMIFEQNHDMIND